jgi:hypothetical protein
MFPETDFGMCGYRYAVGRRVRVVLYKVPRSEMTEMKDEYMMRYDRICQNASKNGKPQRKAKEPEGNRRIAKGTAKTRR